MSDLPDAPIESEKNTLQLQTAQTGRTVVLKPLPDAASPVTVVVAAADRLSGNEAVLFPTGDRFNGDLDASTATTFRQIYAQSRLETRSFFLGHCPQDRCSYRHSPRCHRGAACAQAGCCSRTYHRDPWHALPGEFGNGQVCRAEHQDLEGISATVGPTDGSQTRTSRTRTTGRMQE